MFYLKTQVIKIIMNKTKLYEAFNLYIIIINETCKLY